ncbi:MAG: penicillin-binding protein 2 [Candidatus Spechtbacterales bacterium]
MLSGVKRRSAPSGKRHSFLNGGAKGALRIYILLAVFLLATGIVVFRLYNLQLERGHYYAALALGQQERFSELVPPRGNIYLQDKAGTARFLAATNKEVPLVYAVPKEVEDPELVINSLAGILSLSESDVATLFSRLGNRGSSYALLARAISEDQADRIRGLNLAGVYVRMETTRFYPAGGTAAHVLGFYGFSGSERTGQYGIEQEYEDLLSGADDGGSGEVHLTIDYGVQFVAEQKLRERIEEMGADGGSIIVMDPKTGAILAMANAPTFNPNEYGIAEDVSIFSNASIQGRYEPGSIFKPITMAAALDAGVISPQTTFFDAGSVKLDQYTISNADRKSYGTQTMTQVLEKSLNTGVVFVQQQLGKARFAEYIRAFGFDDKTGIRLPGELSGDTRNLNVLSDVNYGNIAFGQGIALSPLRILTSFSAISNGGTIMKPYVVQRTVRGGTVEETMPQVVRSPISAATASRVTAMMVSVVEQGSASLAKLPEYTIAGKTGTAQVANASSLGYSSRTVHSFVGFAPAYNPRFSMIIKLDNPKNTRYAAQSISPLFGELTSFILQYYNVPPQ